ncbi:MAG: hypothetical protein EU541_05725 [Promethearchaeota archaeon]|nr:MAG: hypothetical protein EU541_05725 [Candidatus Lokiarchaeota archaeon]
MNENKHLSRFIKVLEPSDIEVKREDIYYREKYQEIIEYIKLLLTNSQELSIYKYFQPKGNLLININPGTDIIDYLKVIASNFYIRCIQLKESIILESPSDFFDNFQALLNNLDKITTEKSAIEGEKEDSEQQKSKNKEDKKKLIIIDQKKISKKYFKKQSLLSKFLTLYREKENLNKLLANNILLVWINYDYDEIIENSDGIYDLFDLLISIPLINDMERQQILSDFMEKNPEISFNLDSIVEHTKNWEVKEIYKLLKIAILKHYLQAELNTKSNEITDIILHLIESGEYIPFNKRHELLSRKKSQIQKDIKEKNMGEINKFKKSPPQEMSENSPEARIKELLEDIREKKYSDFMLNQLYENAASEHYNELVIIIDKLEKKEPLETNDRKILSNYPFILNESKPSRAQIHLENAKKRIDLIKKSFGKK